MPQEDKNQHFLPRAYLSGFSADSAKHGNKKVLVYRHDIGSWRPQAIKSTASELYRHSYQLPEGYDHSPDALLKEIENRSFPVLAKLKQLTTLPPEKRTVLTGDEHKTFAEFVMHMYVRTPRQTASTTRFINKLEAWRFAMRHQHWAESEDANARAAFTCNYPEGVPPIARTPHAIEASIEPSLETAVYLQKMDWTFLVTTPQAPFVTCDWPVVKHWGFDDLKCAVSLPLSSTLAFFASYTPYPEYWVNLEPDGVCRYNLMTLECATQMIISSRTDYPGNDVPVPSFYQQATQDVRAMEE